MNLVSDEGDPDDYDPLSILRQNWLSEIRVKRKGCEPSTSFKPTRSMV